MVENVTGQEGRPRRRNEVGDAESLLGFLEHQRATLRQRSGDLDEEQLRTTTFAGVLKHMALMEDHWITVVVGSEPMPEVWTDLGWPGTEDDGAWNWAWDSADADAAEQLRARWETACERSRAVLDARINGAADEVLTGVHPVSDGADKVSLQWVLGNLVEAYGRHIAHANLIRAAIDGPSSQ